MIQANELRVGNYVDDPTKNNKACDVITINRYDNPLRLSDYPLGYAYDSSLRDIEPIPLNENWFINFGFTYSTNLKMWKQFNCPFFIEYVLNTYRILIRGIDKYVECSEFPELKYVHQLQNLYFALTGQELKLKRK